MLLPDNYKKKDAVLIVNPTASPAYLHERFKQANLFTVICFTSSEIDYIIKPIVDGHLFDLALFLTKDFNIDIDNIKQAIANNNLNLIMAFSCSEYELAYADRIAHFFCPQFTNNPVTASWRCNKKDMNTRLLENGTPATQQLSIKKLQDIPWNQLRFPLVVKPAEGGMASIGVAICYEAIELKNYFNDLDNKNWGYRFTPDHFLLEELLIGDEYIIDMVAWKGEYKLIGIYYAEKEVHGAHKICRHREFLPPDHYVAQSLFEYCSTVLKNLDVQYGMMHLECMVTQGGPRLIELNPRVSGVSGMLNYFSSILTGNDQAKQFIAMIQEHTGLPVKQNEVITYQYGVVFYLQNFGFSYQEVKEALFTKLNSYQRHLVKIPTQTQKSYPTTLHDTVAFVILAHGSRAQVDADLQQLKIWEANGEIFRQI